MTVELSDFARLQLETEVRQQVEKEISNRFKTWGLVGIVGLIGIFVTVYTNLTNFIETRAASVVTNQFSASKLTNDISEVKARVLLLGQQTDAFGTQVAEVQGN